MEEKEINPELFEVRYLSLVNDVENYLKKRNINISHSDFFSFAEVEKYFDFPDDLRIENGIFIATKNGEDYYHSYKEMIDNEFPLRSFISLAEQLSE